MGRKKSLSRLNLVNIDGSPGNIVDRIKALEARLNRLEKATPLGLMEDDVMRPVGPVDVSNAGELSVAKRAFINGFLSIGDWDYQLIDTGVIAVTSSYVRIDTEDEAANDTVHIIKGGREGDLLICRAWDSARTVTFDDTVGGSNLRLPGAGVWALTHTDNPIVFLCIADGSGGTIWLYIALSGNTP